MTTLIEAIRKMPPEQLGEFLRNNWNSDLPLNEKGEEVQPMLQLACLAEDGMNFFEDPIGCAQRALTFCLSPVTVREALWLASLLGTEAHPRVLIEWELGKAYLFSLHNSVVYAARGMVLSSGLLETDPNLSAPNLREGLERELQSNGFVEAVIQMDGEYVSGENNLAAGWWQHTRKTKPRKKWTRMITCSREQYSCQERYSKGQGHRNYCLVCSAARHLQPSR